MYGHYIIAKTTHVLAFAQYCKMLFIFCESQKRYSQMSKDIHSIKYYQIPFLRKTYNIFFSSIFCYTKTTHKTYTYALWEVTEGNPTDINATFFCHLDSVVYSQYHHEYGQVMYETQEEANNH